MIDEENKVAGGTGADEPKKSEDKPADRLVATLREIAGKDVDHASVGMIAATAAALIRMHEAISAVEDVLLAQDQSLKVQRQLELRDLVRKSREEISQVLITLTEYGDKYHGRS